MLKNEGFVQIHIKDQFFLFTVTMSSKVRTAFDQSPEEP